MSQEQAAGIRRAQIAANKQTFQLDKSMMKQLLQLYQSGLITLTERYSHLDDGSGHIRVEYLQQLTEEIEAVFLGLKDEQRLMLVAAIESSAVVGASVVESAVTSNAVTSVWQTTQSDGLNLSERIWRLNQVQKRALINQVQTALVTGDSAFKAAREFIEQGATVPSDIASDSDLSTVKNIKTISAQSLLKDKDNALYKAQRLFRTEMARAHSLAYMDSVEGIKGIIGFKFNLSSAHKRTDICDLHAGANLYGLGRGVYPKDVIARLYPAHPQTTSFITAVWEDEVTVADRGPDKGRINWLMDQSEKVQEGILGKQKAEWLRDGLLTERTINSKVSTLRARLKK